MGGRGSRVSADSSVLSLSEAGRVFNFLAGGWSELGCSSCSSSSLALSFLFLLGGSTVALEGSAGVPSFLRSRALTDWSGATGDDTGSPIRVVCQYRYHRRRH